MAKFSQKVQGKEVGAASVYAGRGAEGFAEAAKRKTGAQVMDEMNPSIAGITKGAGKQEKTTGIKIRGTGAATKGTMARGPMG